MNTTDCTQVFNQARIKRGLQPTDWTVFSIYEGMELPCGCKVHNASDSHFSVYHGDNCRSTITFRPKNVKEVIGRPMTDMIAVFIVNQDAKVIALSNPYLGLWPQEQPNELS